MAKKKLLDAIEAKKTEIVNLVNEDKIDEAKTARAELESLQAKYDLIKDLDDAAKTAIEGGKGQQAHEDSAEHKFANAVRSRFMNLTEGSDPDGGYTVPKDIQTRVNKYKESKFSLLSLVDVETVTTMSGRRTFQKRSQQTGFTKVGEGGKIGKAGTPQFAPLAYEISKFAGYMPVTNELLDDSDANINATVITWLGDEEVATDNREILAAVKTKKAEDLKDLDGIQKAFIVKLGAAFASTSKVITNDDGLLYLSTLKDTNGNYLLKPQNNDPLQKTLALGAMAVPVVVVGNATLTSDTSVSGKRTIPFIVGDLKEGVKKFDRKKTSIMISNVAAIGEFNAYENDMTLFRAIMRADYKVKDAEAFVNGTITVDDKTVQG